MIHNALFPIHIVIEFSNFWCWNFEFESRSCEVYWMQHRVIKSVNDMRQICGFLRAFRFPPPIKVTATILLKYCWKWR